MALVPGSETLSLAVSILVAVGVGALIGLEREQSESAGLFAGSRTFPLLALYGALVQAFYPSAFPLALLAIGLALIVAYGAKVSMAEDLGLTTLTAALLTVLFGAMAVTSEQGLVLTVVLGGLVVVLLSAKRPIHDFADRIDPAERRATTKFVLVALVVFPLLPDRDLTALYGLNPRFVWLMVVFVSGLSFAAYLLSRVVGAERGIALTGVLGGFVSSTATAVAMAERVTEAPSLARVGAFATVVAAVVMFPRALVEVAVVNPALLPLVAVPLGAMTVVGGVLAAGLYWRSNRAETPTRGPIENPFRLRPALVFGALFAVVLVVSDAAHASIGPSGVYAAAFLAGLADIDAITISLSRLAAEGALTPAVATTGIVIAAIANTLVKAGLVWVLGTRSLGWRVTAALGGVGAVGLVVALV
jgi:uncharacterized membrane protein (DUF4010 family)